MYLFFDTETSGLPRNYNAPITDFKNWPRLVQIAWAEYDEVGRQTSAQDYIIKPEDFKIQYDAERVHGISTERALKEGTQLAVVLSQFMDTLEDIDSIFVGHNIDFDRHIIGAELLRLDYPRSKIDTLFMNRKFICTMKNNAVVNFCGIPGSRGYKWPKLSELYKILFNKRLTFAHSALADVETCAKCFFKLRDKGIIS